MSRVDLAAGLRATSLEMMKRAGLAGALADAFHGADLVRAGVQGGGTGVGVGLLDSVIHGVKAFGMSPAAQRAAMRAGGSQAEVLDKMKGTLLRGKGGAFSPLAQQGGKRIMQAAGAVLPGVATPAAAGTLGHVAGQMFGQHMIARKASEYMPYAAGAAGLGGFLAAKD